MSDLGWWKKACAVFVVCVATAMSAPAQTFNTLATFNGPNGDLPGGPLVQGPDGSLYGVTYYGGTGTLGDFGDGTIFKITANGILTTLYNFCSKKNCADGGLPSGPVVLSPGGDFFGTTRYEGVHGGGTIYRITAGGNLTTLYDFCAKANCADGDSSYAGLVQGIRGDFYGTTAFGGPNLCGDPPTFGCGTVFKLTRAGELTTLYSFCSQPNCTDGYTPQAGLLLANDGNFYGTTSDGDSGACTGTCGTIFRITPGGTLTTLYRFCSQANCADGYRPYAGLVQAGDGNLYGTTFLGGDATCDAPIGCGTVFKITPAGALVTLHSFGSSAADGIFPYAGLIQATDGNLYGTTDNGGVHLEGTVFEITTGGTVTTLYSFCSQGFLNCDDGQLPGVGLVQATNGMFYGTAEGGPLNDGIVFSLDVGLSPFVTFVRAAGKVGQIGGILGQGFTGTTSVSLNGIPASFTVASDTYIRATVPTGATTGYVTVTTPSGTLTSNVPFHVIK